MAIEPKGEEHSTSKTEILRKRERERERERESKEVSLFLKREARY